jgi:hypothetical protein
MTSSSSSNFVIPGSSFTRPTPNIHELSDLVGDRNFHPFLDRAFQPGYVATSELRHFASLSNVIREMEHSLDQYRFERETIFNGLLDSRRYQQQIRPVFRYYRTLYPRQTQQYPHSQPGRPSSSSSSSHSSLDDTNVTRQAPVPASPVIAPETADALLIPLPPSSPASASSSSSHTSADDRSLSLGTQTHPIVIEDDDNDLIICTRCNQIGHVLSDCDARIRLPGLCFTCDWTRQTVCDHYEASPVWLRRLQQAIDRRG